MAAHATGDEQFMARALALAASRLGKTAPNPAVGCVITRGGVILAEGATGAGGRPHAEERALALLAARGVLPAAAPRGAGNAALTVYVTLEPCAARSQPGTVSCAARLAAFAPGRVVIGALDPHFDPPVSGDPLAADADHARRPALAMLRAAGIEVATGVCGSEAAALNLGFLTLARTGRPLVAIDSRSEFYDAAFSLAPMESFEDALNRMGKSGLTRVCVAPGSALAAQLLARGLASLPS